MAIKFYCPIKDSLLGFQHPNWKNTWVSQKQKYKCSKRSTAARLWYPPLASDTSIQGKNFHDTNAVRTSRQPPMHVLLFSPCLAFPSYHCFMLSATADSISPPKLLLRRPGVTPFTSAYFSCEFPYFKWALKDITWIFFSTVLLHIPDTYS